MVLEIKVIPQSNRVGWSLDKSGRLTCRVHAAAEKGKANAEVITMISSALKIPQRDILIVSGATDRHKRIQIPLNISLQELHERLEIVTQLSLV